jgi:O-antigen/teichoic acid export membrane protein
MATEQQPTALEDLESDLLDTPAAGNAAIRGSALRSGGYVAGVLMSLVSVPLLIRHLGSIEYGRYVVAITLVTIVQGVTDVGLGQIGVREYSIRAGAEREWLMRNLLGVRVALTSVGVLLATLFAVLAGYGHAVVEGTFVAGVAMVLTVIQGTFAVPLASQLRLGLVTVLELLRQILSVTAIVILVVLGSRLLPFLLILVPVAVMVLAATALLIRGTVPLRPAFQREEWLVLIRAVLPFAAAVVIATFYLRVTVLLLSLLASELQTGYYATAFAVISVLVAIPALTVGSTLPVLSRAARDDRERLRYVLERLMEVTLIVGAGLGLGLALGARFVVQVLSGHSGGPSVTVLEIESLAILTQFVGATWQYGLLALHRHRDCLIISVVGLALSVVLTFALVPVLHSSGAAVAFSAAEVVVSGSSLLFLLRVQPRMSFSWRVPLKVVLAIVIGGLVVFLPGLGSLAQSLLAVVVYAVVLALTKAIPAELVQALPWRSGAGVASGPAGGSE